MKVKIREDFTVGEISSRLFGSFVEHMGSVVYTGIYEPGHETADGDGFRQDVLSYVKELELGVAILEETLHLVMIGWIL